MGNNPVSGTDPDGGECPECLAKFLADGGKVLNEVVITASRIASPSLLSGITSSLATNLSKSFSFISGVGDSYKSSLTYGIIGETNPSTQANSNDFSDGQKVGRYVALAHGVGQAILGGSIAAGGGTISLSGAGAVIGVPAVALGGTMAVHGGSIAIYSWNNLNKVHNVNSSGGSSGGTGEGGLTAQEIISKFRKGSVMREFPEEFLGKTLKEIEEISKQGGELGRKAKTALKLLKDGRFRK